MRRIFALIATLLLTVSICAAAQVNSTVATATVTYNVSESLTLTLGSPTLALSTTVPATELVTMSWNLGQPRWAYAVGWFSSVTALSAPSGGTIPSSNITSTSSGFPAILAAPCTNAPVSNGGATVPGQVTGAVCNMFYGSASQIANVGNASVTVSFLLTTAPTAAGNYTGTLNVAAAAL